MGGLTTRTNYPSVQLIRMLVSLFESLLHLLFWPFLLWKGQNWFIITFEYINSLLHLNTLIHLKHFPFFSILWLIFSTKETFKQPSGWWLAWRTDVIHTTMKSTGSSITTLAFGCNRNRDTKANFLGQAWYNIID